MTGLPPAATQPAPEALVAPTDAGPVDLQPPPPPHPELPTPGAVWAGRMLLAVGGLFVAAAAIGPIVARRRPTEPPEFEDGEH